VEDNIRKVLFCFVLFPAYVGLPELDTRLASDECQRDSIILLHFILMTIEIMKEEK
jgi:hypothetical protein